jgi:threonine dehydrogenase-like Zn-dependent dehydrogenase
VRLRLTHLLTYALDGGGRPERDAIGCAPADAGGGGESRWFIPGRLPCGGCSLCRRGLVAACAAEVAALPGDLSAGGPRWVEPPERFLTPLDDPSGPASSPLSSEVAAAAGLVALAIQAAAAANLTAGDVAIWVGNGVLAEVGAQLTASRGARSLRLGPGAGAADPSVEHHRSVPELLAELQATAAPEGTAHQRSTRRLFVTRPEVDALSAAIQLADPGCALALVVRGSVRLPADLALPPETRLTIVSGYHPDLVPEALALLRRGELKAPTGQPLTD